MENGKPNSTQAKMEKGGVAKKRKKKLLKLSDRFDTLCNVEQNY